MLRLVCHGRRGNLRGPAGPGRAAGTWRRGVNFIYNNDLVPPGLVVQAEPARGAPVDMAREILAAYGLTLLPVGGDAFAVVKDGSKGAAGAAAAAHAAPSAEAGLPEIVVTVSRYALAYNQPQTHTLMTQADVQTLPKLADETLRAVQRLPGSAASGISAQSHIRGGELDEFLMVLDGLPLNEPFHLKNFLTPVSVFDVAAIDSMDVYSGGFTANYGDRMSGVIDITSLSPPAERYTELGLSLFHANALSAGTFSGDRGTWLATVRRSNLDLIADAIHSDVGKPKYFDAFGRVSFDVSDTTTFFGSALTSRDQIQANTLDQTERTDADYDNTYVWGGWQQKWPRKFSSRLILALTDIDNDRNGTIDEPGQQLGSVDDSRKLRTGVARLDLAHEAERLYTRFGVEARSAKATYHYASTITNEPDFPIPGDPGSTVTRNLNPDPDGHQFAAYVTSRVSITDRVNAELGLRWDDADLRRRRRSRAVRAPAERDVRGYADDAPARRLGAILAVAGHQRIAGRGRSRHVLPGAARRPADPEPRAQLPGRPGSAHRGLPEGLRPRPAAFREPVRPGEVHARARAGPRRGRAAGQPRPGRGADAVAAGRWAVVLVAELRLVAGHRPDRAARTWCAAGTSAIP